MRRGMILAAAGLALVLAVAAPPAMISAAEQTAEKSEPSKQSAKPKRKRPTTAARKAQQAKFTACAKDWGEHKKATGAKGRKAYSAFMRDCLRRTAKPAKA